MAPPEPGPADHLRAHVDRATSGAGDSGADPDATRLRLAMAGESPARFRDRLLLERAAWFARETDRPLRDIAAGCGFRGYDVFVRAFRRELGASPSEWRADPTTWEIDAPGEVHFHPPDGIRLPARASHDDTPSVTAAYVDAFAPDPTIVPLVEE
ncbi:AraC family transcriptional regulator [Nocardioides eburneiflavus]|uniref:AraC family transcriptional regulator n=1 Tax=Nocardioides eburneiflavus TaxID=2518372 RepID=A0A4Z1C9K0_9ACTN|nr:helix-turn-helix domain-containing protein [Nocardioides eburneiflavus]TGN63996.1 AraC family transcriptional regulator [Nocardioides eburneiflavus]